MPFDSLGAPPEWRRAEEPEKPWTGRDRLVAAAIVLLVAVIAAGQCSLLVRSWTGVLHGA